MAIIGLVRYTRATQPMLGDYTTLRVAEGVLIPTIAIMVGLSAPCMDNLLARYLP